MNSDVSPLQMAYKSYGEINKHSYIEGNKRNREVNKVKKIRIKGC